MRSTISKVAWIAARPKHWVDIPTLVRRHVFPDRRDIEVSAALAELDRLTVPTDDLADIIPGFKLIPFEETFVEEWAAAKKRTGEPLLKSGPGYLDVIYSISEAVQATRVIETGVAYGWSSLAFLMSLRHRPNARLVSVDRPYPGLKVDIIGLAVPPELKTQWSLYKESDRLGIPLALADIGTVDLAHYDSDKTYAGHRRSLPKLWAALKGGGVLICDDAGDNAGFLDFCKEIGMSPTVVRRKGKHVGVLVKR